MKPSKGKFLCGDEVKVIKAGSGVGSKDVGKKAIITKVGGTYGYGKWASPGVKTDRFKNPGYGDWISEESFELVKRGGVTDFDLLLEIEIDKIKGGQGAETHD